MNEKIKTICSILITVSIITGTIFYCYNIYSKHSTKGSTGATIPGPSMKDLLEQNANKH